MIRLSLAALALLSLKVDPPTTYECHRLTLQGNNVVEIESIPCPIFEDNPRWICATMGNLICGDVYRGVY